MDFTKEAPILVTCPMHAAPQLAAEIGTLGLPVHDELPAGARTEGSLVDCMRLNLHLRTGMRVQYELARLRAADADALYAEASRLPWEEIVPEDGYLSVSSAVRNQTITDSRFANLRLKDAVVDRINARCGRRPDSGPDQHGCVLFLYWQGDEVVLSLDTSGETLARRGYRRIPHRAPMQETLAAACILASAWEPGTNFIAPMCGSGTLAIEAALLAVNAAPGLLREGFAFQRLVGYAEQGAEAFEELRRAARKGRVKRPAGRIIATDIDPRAVEAARRNAVAAEVDHLIEFGVGDFRETEVPPPPGAVMLNPEYGARLGDKRQLETVYAAIGDFFKKSCGGYLGYIFTGNLKLAKRVGLRTRRRLPFFNAKIECRLLEYELYAGSRKDDGDAPAPGKPVVNG